MSTGLYIHVPFCKNKCPYCDFYSLKLTQETEKKYTEAVIRNLEQFKGETLDTIYFGGGTPSILSAHSFYCIFKAINKFFKLDNAEITLEANPSVTDIKKLKSLKNVGFNRISFGVQSCDDNELKQLGRIHNFSTAKTAILNASQAGFENISCDVMLGIIGQTKQSLENTIDKLTSLPINHISAYILKIEENTPYNCEAILKKLPCEDLVCDLYEFGQNLLSSKGFNQYEVSNFSKKGFESKHNLKYWECKEYIGIGPSAHSFYNKKRYYCPPCVDEFINDEIQKAIERRRARSQL